MTLYDASILTPLPVVVLLLAGLLSFLFRRAAFGICLCAALMNGLLIAALFMHRITHGVISYEVGGWTAPLGIALRVDSPAILLLAMTAISGLSITLYGFGYFSYRIASPQKVGRHERQQQYFWPLWMLLWAGLNGIFLAGDVFNIYVALEIVGIAAVSLAALSGKTASQIAAFRYLLVNLLGSLSYLLGVTILYKIYATLDLSILKSLAQPTASTTCALALISIGLMLKTALFPMHFWLPPAHANALAPVSAILSALVVKGSFYLLFRFWFDIFAQVISWQSLEFIGALGCGAILWGAFQAMRQQRLKLLIAYSTVSQLGYLFVAFPLVRFDDSAMLWGAVLFMAVAHSFAKSAMFMCAGAIFLYVGHDRINELSGLRIQLPVTVFAFALAGVNLMGLPPTGGFIAKWLLLSSSFMTNEWWWGLVIMVGSLLASAYVFKVVHHLFVANPVSTSAGMHPKRSIFLEWPAFVLALFAFLLGVATPYTIELLALGNTFPLAMGGPL